MILAVNILSSSNFNNFEFFKTHNLTAQIYKARKSLYTYNIYRQSKCCIYSYKVKQQQRAISLQTRWIKQPLLATHQCGI